MNTTHRFTLTGEQVRTIIAEKFGLTNLSLTAEVREDQGYSIDVEFAADFKTAAKINKKVERFQGVEESEE